MDFLNQFSKQISELFRSMTPGSKIAITLMFCILVVGLFLMFSGKVIQSGEYLFSGESFSPSEIQLMEAALGAEGLSGWKVEGSKIKIQSKNKGDYYLALVKNKALPAGCSDAELEAIDNAGIMDLPSKFDQAMQKAKSTQFAQDLSRVPIIEWARVQCYRNKPKGFLREERCSAAVMVGPKFGESISVKLAKDIQQTAAGALGIPAADITITDMSTGRSFSGNLDDGEIADNQLKNDYEKQWMHRIENLLGIPGMTVAVNVELDPYNSRREIKVTPDKKPVTRNSYEKTTKVDRKAPAPGGRPGFSSNQPNRLVQTATQMSTDSQKDSETITANEIGGVNEEAIYATGREKQVNVSIQIPSDYYVDVWKNRNPTPEGEEAKTPTAAELTTIETESLDKAKQSVANLLSAVGGADAVNWVNVTTRQSLAPAPIEAPGMTAKATAWLSQYWTVLGLFVLAFLSLRVLRSVMRGVPVEIVDSEKKDGKQSTDSEETSTEVAVEMLKRFKGSGPSLREELSVMVNQDTDAAATILRGWIGNPTVKS